MHFIVGIIIAIVVISLLVSDVLSFIKGMVKNYRKTVAILLAVTTFMVMAVSVSEAFIGNRFFAKHALLLVSFTIAGLTVKYKTEPKEFYSKWIFVMELIFGIVGAAYGILISNTLSFIYYMDFALPLSLGVGVILFPLDRAIYLKRFSYQRVSEALKEQSLPLTDQVFICSLGVPKSRGAFILERLKEMSERDEIITVKAGEENYIWHKDYLPSLTQSTEDFLLDAGTRETVEIAEGVTGFTAKGLFVQKALGVSVRANRIKECAIGRDPNDKNSKTPERYIYSHVDKPMKSMELELDI